MELSKLVSGRRRILETYGSGTQRVVGWILIVVALVFVADIFIEWDGIDSLRPAAVAFLFAVLAWVTSARPLVIAYEDGLKIRNFYRDYDIDWAAIDHSDLLGELTVYFADDSPKVSAVAVSGRKPDRPNLAGRFPTPFTGLSDKAKVDNEMDVADAQRPPSAQNLQGPPMPDHPALHRPKRGERSKGLYAADRITQMAEDARERATDTTPTEHTTRLAVFEIVLSAVAVAGVVAAFLLV